MSLIAFYKRESFLLLQLIIIYLPLVGCLEFTGAQLAKSNGRYQLRLGTPEHGFLYRQPSARLALLPTAKLSVWSFSNVFLNADSVLSMDDESSLTVEIVASIYIYGRLNLGKRSIISVGRHVVYITNANRTISLGDDSRIKFDQWSSIYIFDNFLIGANSTVHCEESSRIRVNTSQLPACILGDGTRLILRQSSALEISGALILLHGANITVERMSRFTMEANTSLAAKIAHPTIHVGEQSVFRMQKGTHCLLVGSLLIAKQTTFVLSSDIVDERVKCFDSFNSMRSLI